MSVAASGLGWIRSRFGNFRPAFVANQWFNEGGTGATIYFGNRWFAIVDGRIGVELHARVSGRKGFTFR
jgi:hypothetical protein